MEFRGNRESHLHDSHSDDGAGGQPLFYSLAGTPLCWLWPGHFSPCGGGAAAVGGGRKVIDWHAKDIQDAFPGITGFARANIYRMRAFYLAYRPGTPDVAQPVRQLTGKRGPAKHAGRTSAPEPSGTSMVAQPAQAIRNLRQSGDCRASLART
ncbi:MAG: DUF1016 domain-containing protein [Planctomycetes bacterium]|nr:DUF1016 domain-containing protein [Planctomycetota bacterium]